MTHLDHNHPTPARTPRRMSLAGLVAIPLCALMVMALLLAVGARIATPDLRDDGVELVATGPDFTSVFVPVCGGEAASEPLTIPTWCASGDQYWTNLEWTSWDDDGASAVGIEVDNDCGCASGTVTEYPVRLELTDADSRDGVTGFRTAVVTYVKDKPENDLGTTQRYAAVDEGWERVVGE